MQTIVLLVHEEDAIAALEDFSPNDNTCLFIALSPQAGYPLQKRSIQFKTPLDYPRGKERFALGLENFVRIKKTTVLLDSLIVSDHASIPTLKPAQYPVYFLKNLFDKLSTTTHLLKTIIHCEKPGKIVTYTSQYDMDNAAPFPFKAEANIFALVLQLPGWEIPVEIKRRKSAYQKKIPAVQNNRGFFDNVIQIAKRSSLIFNIGLIGKRFGPVKVLSTFSGSFFHPKRYAVLIYESGYNWDDSLPELYGNGFVPILRLTDADIEIKINSEKSDQQYYKILNICKDNEEFKKNAEWCGIDTSPILLPHLATIVAYSLARSPVAYETAINLIRENDIRSILLSIHTATNTHAVIQAAHDSGILVISWQHGGGGYHYHPIMPYAEFVGTDYHLVYGIGVAESYRDTSDKIGLGNAGKFIPIGSSSFDKINERKKLSSPTTKDKILYITSNYFMNFYYISSPLNPIEYDLHLWSVQQKIMNCAKKNPDTNFVIKLHPGHVDRKPLNEYKTDNKIDNINLVVSESSVSEMVNFSDIIILDLVSTSILQVLRYNKPVFVYTGNSPIDASPDHLLRKRAYVYDKEDDFIDAITRFIHNDQFPLTNDERQVDLNNTEFLQSYGTHLNDGKSANRAAAFLKRIIKNKG